MKYSLYIKTNSLELNFLTDLFLFLINTNFKFIRLLNIKLIDIFFKIVHWLDVKP